VALARALVFSPPLILMDEPLGALDRQLREQLQIEIKHIHAQLGITLVYVTHDQSEAMALSDVVVVMKDGRVEQAGPPDEVYRRPMTRFVADFIGRANFLDGEVLSSGEGEAEISIQGQPTRVPAAATLRPGSSATVVVRPESVRIGSGELRAKVGRSTFLGPLVEYELMLGDEVLLAVDPDWMGKSLHQPGDEVAWSLRPEQAYALPPSAADETAPEDPEAAQPAAEAPEPNSLSNSSR
ncbi:MAG: ABC transporter ATP-binding protein, partial [Candidatus Limnocylindria bacterium]